jgi:hypothetical protein
MAESGVVFPSTGAERSTSALGRAVVADALRPVDPIGARAAEGETSWRQQYRVHFRRLVEAGLTAPEAGVSIARAGLDSLHRRMKYSTVDGDADLAAALEQPVVEPLASQVIEGTGKPEQELIIPYRGGHLSGSTLQARLDAWVEDGIVEPSCAAAVRRVAENPQWLNLAGRTVVVLGAGAEMSPLTALLRWGAEVVGVDLPRPPIWDRLRAVAQRHAGRLRVPVSPGTGVGANLLHEVHRVAAWLSDMDGPLTLGNYAYADGATHVRVTAAVEALTARLLRERTDIGVAFLATPTDVFAVPPEAVAEATRRYGAPSGISRMRRPLRMVSGGRLFARNYPPEADPGINDSLVLQQGPNYALAKRIQRWRAIASRADGRAVSLRVAPSTRTRSVVRNRLLGAAFAGAHRFGVEVFEPATSNTLMAALLVHDLVVGPPSHPYPWQDEADGAAHGGLWTLPYAPRSVLGIAVLFGVGSARG